MDWAAVVTAAGTISLAVVGGATLLQGRRLMRAATDEAETSAALVAEMRHDRELAHTPVLSVRWPEHVPGTTGPGVKIWLTNAGAGPAIACRYVGFASANGPTEVMSPPVDVSAAHTLTIFANQPLDPAESLALCKWVDDSGIGHTLECLGAIFAKDLLGWRYRFVVVKDSRSQAVVERTERWRPGATSSKPSWAASRHIWPDYGRHQ